ncbi:MAG: hypothetical protein R3B06_11750 [Kofleriaceae bacterium]
MRTVPLLVAAAAMAATAGRARAEPAVTLVVAWTPGLERTPLAAAAQQAGVAWLDRTPEAAPAPAIARDVARAVDAYDRLQLDDARAALATAEAALDASGGGAGAGGAVADLFVYRALVAAQQDDLATAWEAWTTAAAVAPARVLDPARFPPRAVADHERARTAVLARAPAALVVDGAPGCPAWLDGRTVALAAPIAVPTGPHWLRVECPQAQPWGRRLTVVEPTTRVTVTATPLVAPGDDELRVVARGAGALAYATVVVAGPIVILQRLGADGRVRAQRTVALADGAAPVAAALAAVLAVGPDRPRRPWYQSRWAWAAGAAVGAAAVLVPLTLVLADDGGAGSAVVVGPGRL